MENSPNSKGIVMTRHIGISVPHRKVEEDDDIQDYKKPWVGLTDEEISELIRATHNTGSFVRAIERKLKEKNF